MALRSTLNKPIFESKTGRNAKIRKHVVIFYAYAKLFVHFLENLVNTFLLSIESFADSSELTAVGDNARSSGLTVRGADLFERIENLEATDDLAEDDVLTIEPRARDEAEEELGAVGVGTGVSHREVTSASVLDGETLILELHTVDGLATGTVAGGEVTTLGHELRDDSVEGATLVVKGLATLADTSLTSAESSEVLGGLGDLIGIELHNDAAGVLATDGDIEENLRVGHILLGLWLNLL